MRNILQLRSQPPIVKRYRSIPVRTLFYMSWKNLSSKKLRSSLTIAGVVIGVGAIFFLVALGLGLRGVVTNEILGSQSVQSIDILTPNSRILKLDQTAADRIAGLPHVSRHSESITLPASLRLSSSEVDGIIYGIDTAYQGFTELTLMEGRLLKSDDSNSAVINQSALRSMGIRDDRQAIGKVLQLTVPLKNTGAETDTYEGAFFIVGVIKTDAGSSEVFVPRSPLQTAGVLYYSQIKVLAEASSYVSDLRSQIESMGFETNSPLDTIEQINQVFRYFTIILLGLGTIGMLVSILGMFNTLTISLLERTKEIGLMIALGGRHKDMRRLFVFEAMLMSTIGAVLGVVFATLLGTGLNIFMNVIADRRGVSQSFDVFATPLWLMLAVIAITLLIGLMVVYFPAKRSERINPIDALRRE